MIEVEKKFQPTEEQLARLLADSVFIERKQLDDIYYDYPDFRLIKDGIRFRSRNGSFELKVHNVLGGDNEIEDEAEIKKYFKTDLDLKDFIKHNLVFLMESKTDRQKYKNGIFEIDIDRLTSDNFKDFIFDMCEIELLVENENKILEANKKIEDFAMIYGLEKYKMSKKEACLKAMNPIAYKEIYGNK